jgi:replicative DNA helicase Mcm
MKDLTEFFNRYYRAQLLDLATQYPHTKRLVIDFHDLATFDSELADKLISNPDVTLKSLEEALAKSDISIDVTQEDIRVRVANIERECKLTFRDIGHKCFNKFIAIEGVVSKISEVTSRYTTIAFQCKRCSEIIKVPQSLEGNIVKPLRCLDEQCNREGPFDIDEEHSQKVDLQRLVIQEPPELLERSTQPRTLIVYLIDDLIDPKLVCGDNILISGILRGIRIKDKPELYPALEANYIQRKSIDHTEIEINDEDRVQIEELARRKNTLELLAGSYAPSIYGYEEVKQALVLQQFGGVHKIMPDNSTRRGNIHIALITDPALAKSILLRIASELSPRGIYVAGSDATKAGLTATAVKDEYSGRWTLEAGAIVLANEGLLAVDEVDKLNPEDRAAFHEAMEQQTISIDKAGIVVTFPARTSILAALNPKNGRFDPQIPLLDQLDLSPALASRFDLIFTMRDKPDEQRDRELARFILQSQRGSTDDQNTLPRELLRKYIAYAKRIKPELTQEAMDLLESAYVELRKKGNGKISITTRQLEAMIRLSEAHARMRLSKEVQRQDAEKAIELMLSSLKEVFVDPVTGEIDVDIIEIGSSKSQRDRIKILRDIIIDLQKDGAGEAEIEKVLSIAEEKGISREQAQRLLTKMKELGDIYELKVGKTIKLINS